MKIDAPSSFQVLFNALALTLALNFIASTADSLAIADSSPSLERAAIALISHTHQSHK